MEEEDVFPIVFVDEDGIEFFKFYQIVDLEFQESQSQKFR